MTQNSAPESQGLFVQIATVVPVELFYEETVAEVRQSLLEADTLSGLHLSQSNFWDCGIPCSLATIGD